MSNWIPKARRAVRRALTSLKAEPPRRLSQWAEEYFYLSAESSYVEGKWKAYPPQIAILDAFGNDDIEEVDVKKASRTGYTKMLLAASAFFTTFRRRKQCIWQPTDSDAEEFVELELNPMLRDVKPIKDIFPALEKKHQHNTNSRKKFLGCVTLIKGGSTARNFRRISIDVGILDEIDGFDKDIDGEGSGRKLAKKRTEGATFPKLIVGSTPKLKYLSEIDAAIQEADAIYTCKIPCPHCGARQTLEFGGKNSRHGLKWTDKDPETAAYCCIACASLFTQADYLQIWQQCRWEDSDGNWYSNETGKFYNADGEEIRPPKHIAFDKYWTIYSPQATWVQIVKEWLSAADKAKHGDKSELKTFVNTTLGETYEDDVEKTDADELKKRAEDYPLQIVPIGGLSIMVGIDVQKDRFELTAVPFGRGEEMWVIDYQVIEANPAIQSEWDKLDSYLLHRYPHAAGTTLSIDHVAIDTGGHWTHQCYNYVRSRRTAQGWSQPVASPPKVYATKGSSKPNEPISSRAKLVDVNNMNKVIKHGVKLYIIGTDTAKDLIHGRLHVTQPGPGCLHLSKHLPEVFFEHITNEVRIIKRTTKGDVSAWVLKRSGLRNEGLDCLVMSVFCAHKAALHRKTQAEWQALENIVQPNQHDIFAIQSHVDQEGGLLVPPKLPVNQPKTLFIPS
jgi:phage terminase large subunit GpA-like protein